MRAKPRRWSTRVSKAAACRFGRFDRGDGNAMRIAVQERAEQVQFVGHVGWNGHLGGRHRPGFVADRQPSVHDVQVVTLPTQRNEGLRANDIGPDLSIDGACQHASAVSNCRSLFELFIGGQFSHLDFKRRKK